jgi:hypothetical protein
MPAVIILELSGEAVRSRLCTFTDAAGHGCVCAPFTTIARQVASGDLPAARYHASGPVIVAAADRTRREHLQIGFEWFGAAGSPEEDASAGRCDGSGAGGWNGQRWSFGDARIIMQDLRAAVLTAMKGLVVPRVRAARPRELLAGVARGDGIPPLAASIAAMPVPGAIRGRSDAGRHECSAGWRAARREMNACVPGDRAPDTATIATPLRYLDLNVPMSGALRADRVCKICRAKHCARAGSVCAPSGSRCGVKAAILERCGVQCRGRAAI